MATISQLVSSDLLIKLDPQLEPNELEHRCIYVLPSLLPRLEAELPAWTSIWDLDEQTPLMQFDALLEIFFSGEALTFGPKFKPLNHLGVGVWQLKTADIRMFGWFPYKDIFVAAEMDLTTHVKTHNLYAGYAGQVVRKRDALNLDHPKFVTGEDPHDVVSNYDYP